MQYVKLSKSKPQDSPCSPPLYFHSFFAGDPFFTDPELKFPPTKPKLDQEKSPPTQREHYRLFPLGHKMVTKKNGAPGECPITY